MNGPIQESTMRFSTLFVTAALFALAITGCDDQKSVVVNAKRDAAGEFKPAAAPPGAGGSRMASEAPSGKGGSPSAAPAGLPPFEATKAGTDSPPPARPMIDGALTGVERRPSREPQTPTGILTAGSFDDNLYPPFFRSFVNKAGQNPLVSPIIGKLLGRRLEVFVKNGGGAPVGNARVRLSTPARNHAVEVVTRSDGRAVFLGSLDQFETDTALTVTATSPGGQAVDRAVEKDADRVTLVLPTASAPPPRNLDLAIVLDTTGSMGDEINFLKAEIKDIAAAIRSHFPNINQRYALVCYRDEGMGDAYTVRKFEFTSSIDEFRSTILAQDANGGGDTPEAMHRGLEEALGLQWRDADTARVLFLVADAPPHGRHAATTLTHISALRQKGIAIYPLFASNNEPQSNEATEVVMRAAALLTGGQYLFLTDDSGVGAAHGEPHIPYYNVEKLNRLIVRMIAGELAGKRTDPDSKDVLRTVGQPPKRPRQD